MTPLVTTPDAATLIRRSKQGDCEAFGQLVLQHQDRLFNAVYRMVGRYEDAADIAQEAFLKAFKAIDRFREDAAFYTWLFQIAVNTVMSKRRKDMVRKESQKVPLDPRNEDAAPAQLASGNPGPEALAQNAELGENIHKAIGQLEEEYRLIVVLKDIEGFDYKEIAEMLGCPHGTVKSRLHRARLQLREALRDAI